MKVFDSYCCTVDMFGNTFFRDYKFCADDNIHILYLKKKMLNKNISKKEVRLFYFYIITLLKYSFSSKFGYGRQVRKERLKNEKIELPITDENVIDFYWIEKFMLNNIYKNNFDCIENHIIEKENINFNEWYLFNIKDIFSINGTKTTEKINIQKGYFHYITTKNTNNGIESYSLNYTEEGNCITFDSATDGKCFFQDISFSASDHVEVLKVKESLLENPDKLIYLFLVTVLNYMNNGKYSFGRKRAQTRMKNNKILLPFIKKEGKIIPNFKYMKEYMKSLKYYKYLQI